MNCNIFIVYLQYIDILVMVKEKDILIRVDSELKEELQQKAKSLGLSLSSYIRLTLIKELKDG